MDTVDRLPAAAATVSAANASANATDAAWASAARTTLTEADAALAARFDRNEDITRLLHARTQAVDSLVREAWARCVPAGVAAALFAVGGYGRGELFLQSDIDLLVLAEADAQQANHDALARFFALLWDAGLPVGHAVRSAAECTQAAADITVLTALSEARPLQADAAAVARLADAISPQRVWPPRDYFIAKREEQRARHERFGDTANNLEPNLKEGPGGLRDVQTLRWMALRVLGAHDLQPLIALGQLGSDEYATLKREHDALARLRWGLHLVAKRREERLRFDHQKSLAARLGHVDTADNLAVEQMMQGLYRSAALVWRINDRLLQRFEEQLEGEAVPQPLDAEFELRRGYLAARDPAWPHGRVAHVFALFAAWAARADIRGLHSHTARALAEALPKVHAYTDADTSLRAAFMGLLRGPQPVKTLGRMARLGVLGRWLPAFAQVSGRMQFDLFHVYTVDQHTLAVLKNMAGFASGVADERFAIAHEVWPRLRKPELLLLAGLFHDIGKGRGGDHSELGAVDAREFCVAHGLSDADTELVAWLVQKHLLMSVTSQKQDISDPNVIHRFATQVADRERLDLLYLLTCADIAGTSPKLWNAWKDRLLADLYTATRLALRRGLEHPVAAAERIEETRAAARALLVGFSVDAPDTDRLFAAMPDESFLRGRPDQVAWQAAVLRSTQPGGTRVSVRTLGMQAGALEVFVYSPDRDGLFAAIVATLDRAGLAIQQARLLDGPGGTVFDTFEVLPSDGQRFMAAEEVERRVAAALSVADLDTIKSSRRAQPRHLRHFRIAPQIEFAVTDDGRRTLLSLVCNDRPGLLADVTQLLRAHRLRVHDARIATFGERAEDVFQITDERDIALDAIQQQVLRAALLAQLDGETR